MELIVDDETLSFKGLRMSPGRVSDLLEEYVSASRRETIDNVLQRRTLNIATVIEGSVNSGNVSAVMRTAEAFGFLPFHVIKTSDQFKNTSRSSQGSDKWLDIHHWESPGKCLETLKSQDYRIVATVPDETALPVDNLDYNIRTAFVLGNEVDGLSGAVLAEADEVCRIQMTGFVESFNISVAAALCLYQAFLSRGGVHSGDLTENQMDLWRALYYYRSVRRPDDLLARLLG